MSTMSIETMNDLPLPGAARDTRTAAGRVRLVMDQLMDQGESLRSIASQIHVNYETLRRTYHGQSPSAEVLVRLSERFGVRGEWLLMGTGPRMQSQYTHSTLASATAADLFRALATRWKDRRLTHA